MKNHRFLWLRNRTTDNRKCEKARNIKEKRTIEMFSTVSRQLVAQASSPRDNLTPEDKPKTIVSAVVFCVVQAYFSGICSRRFEVNLQQLTSN